LQDFGPEFEQVLLRADAALREGKPEYAIDFAEPRIAANLRFRLYAYFKALRETPSRPELTAMSEDISMRVAGSSLVFYRSNDTADAAALRDAMGLPKDFAAGPSRSDVIQPPSPLDRNLERLRSIRNPPSK
jgi:hypothetical protein